MSLTTAQKLALKTAINADPALAAQPLDGNGLNAVADALNLLASPDFWVWRTNVTRSDIYHTTSPDATTWNWTTYKQQSVPEQGAWVQIFMGDSANFSLANLRAGITAIFTGSAPQTAQRDHCLSIGRRRALRAEMILAAGQGTAASPAVMGFEGNLSSSDVESARRS